MKHARFSGYLLLGTGLLHTLSGVSSGLSYLRAMLAAGLVNTVPGSRDRGAVFWFLVAGTGLAALLALGYERPLAASFGWGLLALSVVGAIMLGLSGFLLVIPQALYVLIIAYRRGRGRETASAGQGSAKHLFPLTRPPVVNEENPMTRVLTAQPVSVIRRLWRVHAPLTVSALVTALVTVFFVVGVLADSRVITGAPAWLKPAKFSVSITLYSLTLVWTLGFIEGRKRLVNVLGWTVVVTFALEWVAILTQVVRGTTSHFNVATPFDAALWGLMGGAIAVLWAANFVVAGLLLFQRFENPAFAWSLRLGVIVTFSASAPKRWNISLPPEMVVSILSCKL